MPTSGKQNIGVPEVHFYLAEDIRNEIGGKVSAIGLYPDNVVVIPLPASVPDPTESAPIIVRSLAFLFNISHLAQESDIGVDLQVNGQRKTFLPRQAFRPTEPGRSISLIGMMVPGTVSSFGEKLAIVSVGGLDIKFKFEIRRVIAPSAETIPLKSKALGPKRTPVKRKTSKSKAEAK